MGFTATGYRPAPGYAIRDVTRSAAPRASSTGYTVLLTLQDLQKVVVDKLEGMLVQQDGDGRRNGGR